MADHAQHHVVAPKVYIGIFLLLMVLTAITVVVAFQDLGPLNTVVALSIAFIKSSLVVLYFMHLKYGTKQTKIFVLAGLFWVAIMFVLMLSDYMSRGWQSLASPW